MINDVEALSKEELMDLVFQLNLDKETLDFILNASPEELEEAFPDDDMEDDDLDFEDDEEESDDTGDDEE